MFDRMLVGTLLFVVFLVGHGNCAELFAKYNGKSVWLVKDNDGKNDFYKTIDAGIFPLLGGGVVVDAEIINAEISKQESQVKEGTSHDQFSKIVKQLNQIKIGLDYYKKEISKPGSELELAMKNSWDFATSTGVATGLKREYFMRTVESAARGEGEYNSFVSMIPKDLDDAIAKSKNGWRKEALREATLAKLTENITLDAKDLDVLASDKLGSDPAYRHIQTTDTLLSLKKSYVLRRRTVELLLENDALATPALKNELAVWWKGENEKYLNKFPQWGDLSTANYLE